MAVENMEAWPPEKTLGYLSKMGSDIANGAEELKAMLEIAQERGIQVSIADNPTLKSFEALGNHEKALRTIIADIGALKANLFSQRVGATREEIKSHIEAQKSGM